MLLVTLKYFASCHSTFKPNRPLLLRSQILGFEFGSRLVAVIHHRGPKGCSAAVADWFKQECSYAEH